MYNHENQYRCTIIRGKAKREIDNFLPAYAKVINEICPCEKTIFAEKFNSAFSNYLPPEFRNDKTLNNHRTEIAGSLFGMYYCGEDGLVYESERTQKFLEDNDQPAFFKDVCYKLQFPNGMQKIATVIQRKEDKINVRPLAFLLKTLLLAKDVNIVLDKKQIGYYILNSLDVLRGEATPAEVIEQIKLDEKANVYRVIANIGDKASSYYYQHITEQLNYLELANLVVETNHRIYLNINEEEAINIIADCWNVAPDFNVYNYNLDTREEKLKFQNEWDYYYSKLSKEVTSFYTTASALGVDQEQISVILKDTRKDLGDEGERYVFEYEKNRVAKFNQRLVNKVKHLGGIKGLGYDIQSVIAEPGGTSEFVKYIEVKSTKRVTEPDLNDCLWLDSVTITRNEWVASQQHKNYYSIYRVYFVRGKVVMFVINDLYQKVLYKKLGVTPMTYRVEFQNDAIDCTL